METNSTESPAELDLDALINPPGQDSAMTVTSSVSNLTPASNALAVSESFTATRNSTVSHNGASESTVEVIDLTRPLKTEGESSSEAPTSLTNSDSIMRAASAPSIAGLSAMSPFGSPMSLPGSQLTQEEHSAAYKKANILAITALTRSGGPNAKELLAVQHKLQEFLTSLITLASQKGPQLKQTVQILVQKLVTGAMSEEEFASRVEQDLQSQHQPSLLPFLKNSVPSLKTRLQLQQAIMKQLLQRNQKQATTPTLQQPDPSQQQQQQTQQQQQPSENNKQQPQQPQQQQKQAAQQVNPPTSQAAAAAAAVTQAPPPSTNPGTTTSNPPVPTAVTTTTTQQQQQQLAAAVVSAALPLSNSVPSVQLLRLATDPDAQRRFLEMHLAAATAGNRRPQQQAQGTAATTNSTAATATTAVLQNATSGAVTVQAAIDRQQQIAKEQQQQAQAVLVNSAKLSTSPLSNRGRSKSPSSASFSTKPSPGSASVLGRGSFSNLKLVASSPSPSSSSSSSPAPPPSSSLTHAKGKHKAKGKDVSVDEEEEEEGMDIAGVNLQEESILPATVPEGVSRTCKDETLLDVRALRWRIAPIARRYGITEITDEFLTLLSHATQERLTDVLEKLSVVSRHRLETIKDNPQYQVVSEVKGQLKVLEAIDRLNDKRKQEREKEKILRAAKSRSKGDDPAMAVKIKQQAKQLQQEEEAMILNQAANMRALAAIGTRKRPLQPEPTSHGASSSSSSSSTASHSDSSSSSSSSLFGAAGAVRQTKRRITSRDVLFHLEQERESRKSVFLYKNLLK